MYHIINLVFPSRRTGLKQIGAVVVVLVSIAEANAALQTGILKEEFFAGATRAQVESGTVTVPTAVNYVTQFGFEETGANFARRVSGFFIPPTTGNYVFFVTSDDDSDLFLSTDETPATKRLIAQETGWSNGLEWTASAGGSSVTQKRSDRFQAAGTTNRPFASGIPLVAGQRYYIEGVHAEGGGGDNFAATFKLLADADPEVGTPSALTGNVIAYNIPDAPIILGQPVNRRVLPGDTVTFTTAFEPATGTIQWFRNGTPISGATSGSYTTPALAAADNNATFHAVVTAGGTTAQSSNAVVTVGSLVMPAGLPVKREFWADDALTRADVEGGLTDPDITDAFPTFEAPTNWNDEYVQRMSALFVPPTTGNYVFFLAADDDGSLWLSTDASPATKRQIAAEPGWSGARSWTNVGGPGTLTVDQAVAQKRSDKWVPDPANDPTATPPFAAGIPLTAGQRYYIEAAQVEGGGGDNLAVTYKLVGEPDPANGSPPRLAAEVLAPFAEVMGGATLSVTTPPQNTTGLQNRTATFNIAATAGFTGDASGAAPTIFYQWQTAPTGSSTFTNIPGATGTSFTTPQLAVAESGRQYRVQVLANDAAVITPVATLTVMPDVVAPRPVTVSTVSAGRNSVSINLDEVLEAASATNAANFVFAPGNITATSVSLANGTNVTITTASPLTPNVENTLTITGVRDIAGNPVAANTTIKFTFNPVTYAANILFDAPLGYYRFEEASGSVATNSGTTGGDAIYYVGDEAAPGEGGTPGAPKGDPGPRPPEFAGFEATNHAATFTGTEGQEWVDTRNKFLTGRSAFSIEYWVLTADRANQGNRIGIVGQNDTVEYAYINPNTIEMWTAGGGLVQSAVTFPDNEWHHIATIADGTSIKNYYDGVLVATGGTQTSNYGNNATYNTKIGVGGINDATGGFFNGRIDEVAIFDKAIPADRILAHYRAGKEGGIITISGAVTPSDPSGGPTLTASRSGTTITIAWTPEGGTLESTPTLSNPTWTAVGTANPATVTIGAEHRFFRVRR